MVGKKLILDIRYFESDKENVDGSSLPSYVGKIFPFSKSVHSLGARIARKLRELGFLTGEFDHLYINYTTTLRETAFQLSQRIPDLRIRYVDYGASPASVRAMDDTQREAFVATSTFEILASLFGDDPKQEVLLMRVRKEMEAFGSDLEIIHKVKDTSTYRIIVSYQIRPHGIPSIGLIEYHDKKTGVAGKKPFIELKFYGDVFSLVGSIAVTKGIITLKARSSFKASLYTNRYQIPITIPVEQILNAEP